MSGVGVHATGRRDEAVVSRVRLYPLPAEHVLPMLVDLLFFVLALLVCTVVSLGAVGYAALVVGVVAVHVIQMAFLVEVRFAADAITLVRPWRRRTIATAQIAGLIYSHERGPQRGADPFRLRLVLTGAAPPPGRFLTGAQAKPYARGPVVMTVGSIDAGTEARTRAERCAQAVYAGLHRLGLDRPAPYELRFGSKDYSREEQDFALAIDLRRSSHGTRPVTIDHPAAADRADAELVERVLPELAAAGGADPTARRAPEYSTYLFEGPQSDRRAAEFARSARAAVPADWTVTASALPRQRGPGG